MAHTVWLLKYESYLASVTFNIIVNNISHQLIVHGFDSVSKQYGILAAEWQSELEADAPTPHTVPWEISKPKIAGCSRFGTSNVCQLPVDVFKNQGYDSTRSGSNKVSYMGIQAQSQVEASLLDGEHIPRRTVMTGRAWLLSWWFRLCKSTGSSTWANIQVHELCLQRFPVHVSL